MANSVTSPSGKILNRSMPMKTTPKDSTGAKEVRFKDDKFRLMNAKIGLPLRQTEYAIRRATGVIEYGKTDDEGRTHLLASTAKSEPIEISIYTYEGRDPRRYVDPHGHDAMIPGPHGNGEKWIPPDTIKIKQFICQAASNGGMLVRDPSSRDLSLVYAEHYIFQYQNVKNHPGLYGFWWWAPFFYEPSKEMWPTHHFNDKDTSPPTPEAIVWAQRGAEDAYFGKSLDDLRKKYCGCP